ncbi:Barrier-to-autointegration factor [Aphelenchoides avenae]|nr:Barrier-to-autointegration factor [Aphelenchus avenae]
MNDAQVKKVLQETVNFVHNTPMGLQNFRKNKEFELAVSRIDGSVPFKGASGTETYLTSNSKEDQLRDHLSRFTGIVLLKVGKDDRAHEVVVPNASDLHRILGCFAADEQPLVMRLLLEEFAEKGRKCHATVTTFLLTFFAVLLAEDRDHFKRLMAELWSVDEVRTLLQTSYVWSNPNKYLRQATIQMTPFDGEVPERWKRLVLPSLRTGQAQVKPEEEKYYDAPGSPVKAEAVKIDADEKKALKAFHRLMGADAPGPSGLHAMDVKEERPPKRPHPNDRLGSTAAKRRCQGLPTAALQPVARKASQPPLEGPLADRKLSDVDGIDEFVAKRLMEKKGFDLLSLFGQLLVVKLCRMAFVKWLMNTVAIGPEDAERCYKCLREYADKNVSGT